MKVPSLEVCFSPAMLNSIVKKPGRNVVVVDVLRATTAICTAMGYGVASIVPVVSRKEALKMKKQGSLVAGETEGEKLPFADFGNSPREFRNDSIKGKELIFCTTNGTKAIHKAKDYGQVLVASFVNLEAVCGWLNKDGNDVLILCAGWKDSFSLEDAVFAGAMSDLLVNAYGFLPVCDAAPASVILWNHASKSLMKTVSHSAHYLRLLGIEDRRGLRYCFFPEKFHVVPVLTDGKLVDLQFTI
jgi:2-phosphosulfolactate phosphatase